MAEQPAVTGGREAFKRYRPLRSAAAWLARLAALAVLLCPAAALPHEGALKPRLLGVERWLLLLNDELAEDTAGRIAASAYDMAVVDDIATLAWNAGLDVRPLVAALKRRPDGRARLVVSYLNVGQAEDYRSYFREDWKTHPPGWIIGADPEGWAGNYPVAYWNSEWQEIVAGPDGLARRLAREGFDGAHLDWVAGYHDESVQRRARLEGVDARAEMIRLLARVAGAAREVNPDFLLILQNVPDLVGSPEILSLADAFVQEAIWFDGASDGDPPGDCPLPRSNAEARSAAYFASLPGPCARAYRDGRADILNYAQEEEVLPPLMRARAAGLAVLTVDYALAPANAAAAVRLSRSRGFKPFVGARALDAYRDPAF